MRCMISDMRGESLTCVADRHGTSLRGESLTCVADRHGTSPCHTMAENRDLTSLSLLGEIQVTIKYRLSLPALSLEIILVSERLLAYAIGVKS